MTTPNASTTNGQSPEEHGLILPTLGLLIDEPGRDSSSGERIDIEDPATGNIFASVPAATKEDVSAAVASARRAFESREWSRMRPLDRAKILENIARKIEEHADELALLESFDNGKAVTHAKMVDVPAAVDVFRYMAGWTTKLGGH